MKDIIFHNDSVDSIKSIDKVKTNSINSEDYHNLEEMDIQLKEELMKGTISEIKDVVLNHSELEKPPNHVKDIFSKVLGNVFHFIDKMKVPISHCHKKRYFSLL